MEKKRKSAESLKISLNQSKQVMSKSEHALPKSSHDSGIELNDLWFEPGTSVSKNIFTDHGISSAIS